MRHVEFVATDLAAQNHEQKTNVVQYTKMRLILGSSALLNYGFELPKSCIEMYEGRIKLLVGLNHPVWYSYLNEFWLIPINGWSKSSSKDIWIRHCIYHPWNSTRFNYSLPRVAKCNPGVWSTKRPKMAWYHWQQFWQQFLDLLWLEVKPAGAFSIYDMGTLSSFVSVPNLTGLHHANDVHSCSYGIKRLTWLTHRSAMN